MLSRWKKAPSTDPTVEERLQRALIAEHGAVRGMKLYERTMGGIGALVGFCKSFACIVGS